MFDNVIKLIAETKTTDEHGDTISTESSREVFAEVKSIGQKEFYESQAVGLKPEIKFVIADFFDYQGEQKVRFTPFRGTEEEYRVIRTYRTSNRLEIVCSRGI